MPEIWIAYAPHLNGGPAPEAFVADTERKVKRLALDYWHAPNWSALAKHGWRAVKMEAVKRDE